MKVEKLKWESKRREVERERKYRQWGSLLRQAAALWPTNAELRNSHCWPETHSSGLQILTPTQPLYAHPHPHMIISAVANLRCDYTQTWHNATLTCSCILTLLFHLHCVKVHSSTHNEHTIASGTISSAVIRTSALQVNTQYYSSQANVN